MSAAPTHTSKISGLTFVGDDRLASSDASGRVLLWSARSGSWICEEVLVDEGGPEVEQMVHGSGLLWMASRAGVTAMDPDSGEVVSRDDVLEQVRSVPKRYEGMSLCEEVPVLRGWRNIVSKGARGYYKRDVEMAHNIATPATITSMFYDDAHGELVVSTNHDVVQFYDPSTLALERSFSRKSAVVFRATDPSRIGVAALGGRKWSLAKRGTGRGGTSHEVAFDILRAQSANGRVLFADGASSLALHDEAGALLWSSTPEDSSGSKITRERLSPGGDHVAWCDGASLSVVTIQHTSGQ